MDAICLLRLVVYTAIIGSFSVSANLVCQHAKEVPDPAQVWDVTICGPHEVCSMEQFITSSGFIRHDMRCKDRFQCGGVAVAGKAVVCSECCDSDLCAASLCKNRGIPPGRICFHCDFLVQSPLSCEHIKLCSTDEVCSVSQLLPSKQFDVKCRTQSYCATISTKPDVCSGCCSDNLCNDKCASAVNVSTCVDDSVCMGLKQNFHATGRDICADATFKYFCNYTCGLCPSTTSVMTSPSTTPAIVHVTTPMTSPMTTQAITTPMTSPVTTQAITTQSQGLTCTPNPCQHGKCSMQAGAYTCQCNTGYTGTNCDTVDLCFNTQCQHGTCVIQNGQAGCKCSPGYVGSLCDTDNDECASSPCINGLCLDQVNDYMCSCQQGFTGKNCDQAVVTTTACTPNPCLHGKCNIHGATGYTCSCNTGYTGTNCTILNTPCTSNPCKNGKCTDHGASYVCLCNIGYAGTDCEKKIRDCKDVLDNLVPSVGSNNIYTIKIGTMTENVRCDMQTDGGGWTMLMNRESATQDFMLSSTQYALGFGTKTGNFWLGLEDMYKLTSDGRKYQLRVEVTTANGTTYYEVFDDFSIGPHPDFTLYIGHATGTAGDSLRHHNGYGFTATDIDRDSNKGTNCANYLQGAWWFYDCYDSCLTCPYVTPGEYQCRSMSWNTVGYCEALKAAKMMIRPM